MWADLRIWKLSTIIRKSTVRRRNGLTFMASAFISALQYHLCKFCWLLQFYIYGLSIFLRIFWFTWSSKYFVFLNSSIVYNFVWRKPDWEVLLGLALRRLKLEVSMAGGKVSNSLALATHLVVLSVPGFDVDFETLLKRYICSIFSVSIRDIWSLL